MGVSVGVEPFGGIFPRSSADLDQGLRARFRKSPRPPPPLPGDIEGWVGEERGERERLTVARWGVVAGLVVVLHL